MLRLPRSIPALVLLTLYLLIIMTQLTPLALQSHVIAHSLTGECVSDCSLCGCSAERSASHTCCCWQKKLQQNQHDEQHQPDCCETAPPESRQAQTAISTHPCGSGKSANLPGTAHDDQFPYRFNLGLPRISEESLSCRLPFSLTCWLEAPPHPPPILPCLS